MILRWLRDTTPDAVYTVYTALVEQARRPEFYTKTVVPDTIDGRFDMIVMHLVLFYRRMAVENVEARDFAQNVFDVFVKDMDRSLREMGVGDLSVPKKMKKIGESYFGRSEVYGGALDEADASALADAVNRNIFADGANEAAADQLASYMLRAEKALSDQSAEALMAGSVDWPELEV